MRLLESSREELAAARMLIDSGHYRRATSAAYYAAQAALEAAGQNTGRPTPRSCATSVRLRARTPISAPRRGAPSIDSRNADAPPTTARHNRPTTRTHTGPSRPHGTSWSTLRCLTPVERAVRHDGHAVVVGEAVDRGGADAAARGRPAQNQRVGAEVRQLRMQQRAEEGARLALADHNVTFGRRDLRHDLVAAGPRLVRRRVVVIAQPAVLVAPTSGVEAPAACRPVTAPRPRNSQVCWRRWYRSTTSCASRSSRW